MTIICGRRPPYLNDKSVATISSIPSLNTLKTQLLVIGWGNAFGQTNNHFLAVYRAMVYAFDYIYDLAILKEGWAFDVLKLLFGEADNETELQRSNKT